MKSFCFQKELRDIYIIFNILRFSCQVPVTYIRSQLTCILTSYFLKKTPNIQSHENPSEACFTGANNRMERRRQSWQGYIKKLTVAFRSFANESKIRSSPLLAFLATALPTYLTTCRLTYWPTYQTIHPSTKRASQQSLFWVEGNKSSDT